MTNVSLRSSLLYIRKITSMSDIVILDWKPLDMSLFHSNNVTNTNQLQIGGMSIS